MTPSAEMRSRIAAEFLSDNEAARIQKSVLYRWGLVDDALLKTKLTLESQRFLLSLIASTNLIDPHTEPTVLLKHKIITKESFRQRIIAPFGIDKNRLRRFLHPSEYEAKTLEYLITKKILTAQTLWQFFLTTRGNFFSFAVDDYKFDWKNAIESGLVGKQINVVTKGFNAVEGAHLQKDLLHDSSKVAHYPLNKEAHPLIKQLRGQEHITELSEQVRTALNSRKHLPVMEAFSKVFNTYLTQTGAYQEFSRRDATHSITRANARAANIELVNANQLRNLREGNSTLWLTPGKRYLDIYARYGERGFMDPFQLAIIGRAVHWYVMGGRSRLFNAVRIIPYSSQRVTEIPTIALAACPGSKMLTVRGHDFRSSLVGANRMFLTHSVSGDASDKYSIPIVGLATYNNANKMPGRGEKYVVLQAGFDPHDPYRATYRSNNSINKKEYPDYGGDIAGLIHTTLCALNECEEKEIRRARRYKPPVEF